jgi:mycothiol synthase
MIELNQLDLDPSGAGGFIDELTGVDGAPPLSEHKMNRMGGGGDARVAGWETEGRLVAVSVAAYHGGDEPHWALEVATGLELRTPEGEAAALAAAASTVPAGAALSLWVRRAGQLEAAASLGYRERRRVIRMQGPLPDAIPPSDVVLGSESDVDDDALIELHNRAFAGHREASGLTAERLAEMRAMSWYDPAGVVTAHLEGRLVGYCWTKLHDDGDGEVYLIAVDPEFHRRGLGGVLTTAGFQSLRHRGARAASLWVDGDNAPAIALYHRLGLVPTDVNIEMVKEL